MFGSCGETRVSVGVPENKELKVVLLLVEMVEDGRLGFGPSGENIGVCGGDIRIVVQGAR